MKLKLVSIQVNDQDKALQFYTEVLGFVKKMEFPVGEYKWITVVSPEEPDAAQLTLEPNANPDGKIFQEALYRQGIPVTAFNVDNIQQEYERLKSLGVQFKQEPKNMGPVTQAVFDDTCGNYIQIYQV